jgi:hypothetical protein
VNPNANSIAMNHTIPTSASIALSPLESNSVCENAPVDVIGIIDYLLPSTLPDRDT